MSTRHGSGTEGAGTSARPAAPRLEQWFLRLVLGLSVTAWLALVLAEAGRFSLRLLVGTLAIGGLGALYVGLAGSGGRRRRPEPAPPAPAGAGRAFGAATLLAAALFVPPYETVLLGGDATLYVNVGRKIAETGALRFDDPLVRDLPVAVRAALFRNRTPDDATGRHTRFPGGLLIPDVENPTVTAGFSPLFPVLTAVGHAAASLPGALAVAPIFAVLSIGGLCLVAARVGGTWAGWLAATLAALSLPQIWFAKFPLPEMVAQCFLLAGVLALLVALQADAARWAAAAGWLLGTAGLAKVDLIVVQAVALSAFAAWWLLAGPGRGGRCLGWLLASFGLLAAHAVGHYLAFASHYRPYVGHLFRTSSLPALLRETAAEPAGAALLAGLAGLAAAALARAGRRGRAWRSPRAWGVVCAALVVAYAVNYVTTTRMRAGETIVWLAWYVSWPVLVLAGLGLARLLPGRGAGRTRPGTVFVLVLLGVAGLHYLYDPLESGVQIWSMRRFVPIVLPLLLLAASVAAARAVARVPRPWRQWLAAGSAAALALLVAAPSRAVLGAALWDGAAAQTAAVARAFPPDAVVLANRDLAGTHLPTSLAYLHGVDAVVVQQRAPDAERMEQAIGVWLARGRRVFALLGPGEFSFFSARLAAAEVRTARLDVRTLERTTGRAPRASVDHAVRMRILEVTRRVGAPRTAVDVGAPEDLLFNLQGFHAAERDPDPDRGTYRWTGPRASLTLPGGEAVTLVIAGERPAGVPPASIAVRIGGRTVLEGLVVEDDPRAVTLDAPGGASAPAIDLVIRSTVFEPRALGLSADPRQLGVRVYGARVRQRRQ